MLARDYWKAVTVDQADLLDRFLFFLREHNVRFCVVGGQGVNAYADPVVSLDLDIVVATSDLERLDQLVGERFAVQRFAHSINVSLPGSDLRVQIQTDPRYSAFVDRASERTVLGVTLPVAAIEDLLQGKVWAAQDQERRASKRQKDLADIARLIEVRPDLRSLVPDSVRARLL